MAEQHPTQSASRSDPTDLVFWFPRIEAAGLPVPQTEIVQTVGDLMVLLDGEEPYGWAKLIAELTDAARRIGSFPMFLRTGHTSGKHEWDRCCFVPHLAALPRHVGALVEHSAMAGIMGLPTQAWALRALIDTEVLFRCEGYGGFPVTREFRVFVRDGECEHVQPYWPADAVERGRPDDPEWREKLARASDLASSERGWLYTLAIRACRAVGGGFWSVDLLEDREGIWWLTDMAEGDRSFKWTP